jgi:2'-5'-oligoadenylate synthetase
MKIQITVKVKANAEANSKLQLIVGADDTVSSTKERISALQPIPFTDQDLKLNGKVLEDGKRLSQDCGVQEGSCLDFEVTASEATLAQQLNELLQARDLSSDELGLLYCYKHGVSINQSLNLVGHEGKFVDFLKKQKAISIENGRVALKREETALKPFSVTDEIAQILTESGTMDIKDLKSKFVEKFNVSMASVAQMKPMEFLARHKNTFTVNGRFVSLKGAESEPANSQSAQQMIAPPGLEEMPLEEKNEEVDCQQYLDLHDKICGRSFNSKIAQALNNLVETVSEASFLNISHVVKGGSVGKGTAISGVTDAEVVFFLKGLPSTSQGSWMPSLLKAVAGVLSLGAEHGVDEVCTTEDSLRMRVKGLITVDLRFSPVFDSYASVIQTLGEQGPEARKYFATSLVKERTQFIAKQPGHVKVTIRLLKWWRDQQTWSGKIFRPTDEMLELVSVYSAVQTKPADQRTAIANVMALLAQANDLRIVWSNYYSKDDVWAPLLRQRPLLMDPTNPFINVADPQSFDATELMKLAKTTHFFW